MNPVGHKLALTDDWGALHSYREHLAAKGATVKGLVSVVFHIQHIGALHGGGGGGISCKCLHRVCINLLHLHDQDGGNVGFLPS